ncbi:HmuY family protein [Filimonas effusa]|uniref:Uncharacterized protein n=1 Tax=Filimonas effusa TaxID=2508721 RepID=A0A4Q1DCB9_9BACT|nr:HmuY family protein [Filimonas effusa]RXK86475.1 hypothetical protein ESB13_06615 [Filimonas effusa]
MLACSKSDDAPVDPFVPGQEVATGIYSAVNLAADTNATSGSDAAIMYFSLEQNKMVPASQQYTTNWDIAFGGIYNSSVYVNNGQSKPGFPGYGGPGKGRMFLVVDRKFDAQYYDTLKYIPNVLPIPGKLFDSALHVVKTVPVADDKFITSNLISLDHFQGAGDGWGYYDFYGSLFPGDAKKAHIVYSMPRTIIVKTTKGHYAKIVISSIYKDSPANPNRDNKPGYLTLKYAIQMDGSTNLDIK